MEHIHVLLVFGGHPDEHKVSIRSASNIAQFFHPEKYILHLLYITEQGEWMLCDTTQFNTGCDVLEEIIPTIKGEPVSLKIGDSNGAQLIKKTSDQSVRFDVVFSALTGKFGGDGDLQGLWNVLNVPYTGPSLIGAAIGFDKDVMKRLLREAGLPICKYKTFTCDTLSHTNLGAIKQEFGMPFFMKPANSGSSIGAHQVCKDSEFSEAVEDVFLYDKKLIIEEFIEGSELELYCLGYDKEIKTTIIRETVVENDFFSYEVKYLGKPAKRIVPAKLPEKIQVEVQELTKKAYQILEGRGLARMDLFYSKDGRILINEINTCPVFINLIGQQKQRRSLWVESGVSYQELVDLMIAAAFQTRR